MPKKADAELQPQNNQETPVTVAKVNTPVEQPKAQKTPALKQQKLFDGSALKTKKG